MAKVSVIGAGPAGLIFSYGLMKDGHDVTIYSDRTPDQWLNHSAPTGTAYLYADVIDIERDLDMDFWSQDMHAGAGALMDYKPSIKDDQRIVVAGRMGERPGGAIDQRMRVHRWLEDMEGKGGRVVIESVTPDRLETIAASSDLTVLAAGKADLGRIIPRDEERSTYSAPQRNLAMVICRGMEDFSDRVDFTPIKFNMYGDAGEFFWVPYTHKTAGKTWCLLWEARPGGVFDKFGECRSGKDVVSVARSLLREYAPWEWERKKDIECVEEDPFCWLVGRFAPTVRKAFGRLPSGALVMPLGDTAVTFDPIGGQGGNHASRHARYLADHVTERGDAPFDAAWMESTHDRWWNDYAQYAYKFNNMMLEPMTQAGGTILMKSADDSAFAERHFFSNLPRPRNFFPMMEDVVVAQSIVADWHKLAV